MARRQLPPELAAGAPTHKTCPDCYAEKRDPYILPIEKFYVRKVKNSRYKGGVRISAYCIEHENKRRVDFANRQFREWVEEEERTGVTPPGLAKKRERARAHARREDRKARAEELRQERMKVRGEEIRERAREYHKNWLARPGVAERRARYKAEWYQRTGKQRVLERRRGTVNTLGKSVRRRRDKAAAARADQAAADAAARAAAQEAVSEAENS